jgi:hypothetical protein
MRPLLALLLVVLCPLAPTSSAAPRADVHVDPGDGDDLAGDGSPAAPWRSITHALTQVTPPATIVLAPGRYRPNTGESFPLLVPAGVSLVAVGNPENTLLTPEGSGLAFPDPALVILGTAVPDATTTVRGLGIPKSQLNLEIVDTGPGQRFAVVLDDVVLRQPAQVALRATITGGGELTLTLRDVRTPNTSRALELRASGGRIVATASRCNLSGVANGIELVADGEPESSEILFALDTSRVLGATSNGLSARITDGNRIATDVRDSLFAFHGKCLFPMSSDSWGAIRDVDAELGAITHRIARTVFHANGALCATGNRDLVTYRPQDYALVDNVWSSEALPGGLLVADPGFVDGSTAGFDPHLLPASPARDLSALERSPFPRGDWDGDFAARPGPAPAVPGTVDAGPDEYRPFAVWAGRPPQVGKTFDLRALGSPRAAGPMRVWFLVGAPPVAPSEYPRSLELPAGAEVVAEADLDPATTLGQAQLSVPDDPALAGVELGLQGLFSDGAVTRWSRAVTLRVRAP